MQRSSFTRCFAFGCQHFHTIAVSVMIEFTFSLSFFSPLFFDFVVEVCSFEFVHWFPITDLHLLIASIQNRDCAFISLVMLLFHFINNCSVCVQSICEHSTLQRALLIPMLFWDVNHYNVSIRIDEFVICECILFFFVLNRLINDWYSWNVCVNRHQPRPFVRTLPLNGYYCLRHDRRNVFDQKIDFRRINMQLKHGIKIETTIDICSLCLSPDFMRKWLIRWEKHIRNSKMAKWIGDREDSANREKNLSENIF